MKYIIFFNTLFVLSPLLACVSPRTVGCMHQSADELTLDILQTAINMDNPALFGTVLSPSQISLTAKQAALLRAKLKTITNPQAFNDLLNKKLSTQASNS